MVVKRPGQAIVENVLSVNTKKEYFMLRDYENKGDEKCKNCINAKNEDKKMVKKKELVISWFSAGVSSFIATYLMRNKVDKIVYCHIENQHSDTMRFIKDCEKIMDIDFEILQSQYKSVDNVIKQFKFINSPYGATCTSVLKKRVRKEFEYKYKDYQMTYIWGYDVNEKNRADRIVANFPEHNHLFPLIENNLYKEDCHSICKDLGIKRPVMYELGYRNNNCVGCVKGGMGYWNKIRIDFPDVFKRRAEQERECGHSCIKGVYLDELAPDRGRIEDEVLEDCSIFCHIVGIN